MAKFSFAKGVEALRKELAKAELENQRAPKDSTWNINEDKDGLLEAKLTKKYNGKDTVISDRTLRVVGGEDGYVEEVIKGANKLPELTDSERRFRRVLGAQGLEERGHKGESLRDFDLRTLEQPEQGYMSSFAKAAKVPENLGGKAVEGVKSLGRKLGFGKEEDTRPDPIKFEEAKAPPAGGQQAGYAPAKRKFYSAEADEFSKEPKRESLQQDPARLSMPEEDKKPARIEEPKDKWSNFDKIDRWTQKWEKVKSPERRKSIFDSMIEGEEKDFLADIWNLR